MAVDLRGTPLARSCSAQLICFLPLRGGRLRLCIDFCVFKTIFVSPLHGGVAFSTTPFSDDEGTQLTAADFAVGEFGIINGVLLEVTAVSAPNVTFSTPSSADPLAEGDTFVAINYLPDSPGDQEGQARRPIRSRTTS